jgi:catechol 2,3-dioxygenase-like lactoylglutathione lyase family enzyme
MSPDSGPTGYSRTSEAGPIPPSHPLTEPPYADTDPGQASVWPEPGVTEAADRVVTGTIHHIEFWVPDLDRAVASWGWLLDELGYKPFGDWPGGRSWRAGSTYIVLEQSPDRTASRHDRCRPGLNHLAFHVADREQVEKLVAVAPTNGWRLMFADRHPYAGGEGHYAAYLENADGFEAELVAPSHRPAPGGG